MNKLEKIEIMLRKKITTQTNPIIRMATTVKVVQTIKNTIQVKDTSLKALDKQKIPSHLWKELQESKKYISVTPSKVEVPEEEVKSPESNVESPKVETPKVEVLQPSEYDKYVMYNLKYGILDYSDWERQYPSYWEEQIERLERRRSVFNRKRGWSAKDEYEVNSIDRKLEYCNSRLQQIKSKKETDNVYEFGDEFDDGYDYPSIVEAPFADESI